MNPQKGGSVYRQRRCCLVEHPIPKNRAPVRLYADPDQPIKPPPEPERERPPIRPPNRDPKPEPIKDPPIPPLPGKEPSEDPDPIGDPPDQTDQPIRMKDVVSRIMLKTG